MNVIGGRSFPGWPSSGPNGNAAGNKQTRSQPANAGGSIEPGAERGEAERNPRKRSHRRHKPANAGDSASSQIFLVVFDAIRFQKLDEFFSERGFLVMLFLPCDVILHFFDIRLADGECGITTLP